MTNRVALRPRSPLLEHLDIPPLRIEDVPRLRLGWWSKHDASEIRALLDRFPNGSAWIESTSEFALAAAWRNRPEIVSIVELAAPRHPSQLVSAVFKQSSAANVELVVIVELDETRPPEFYERTEFSLLDSVVVYEHAQPVSLRRPWKASVRFSSLDPHQREDRTTLLEVDRAAFPWLWRNSEEEFLLYADAPGVELYGLFDANRCVGYVGLTAFLGWGHLDRVAVLPERQGEGIGEQAVRFALDRLTQIGARRVGLSTQVGNHRSRRLYERLGFHRSGDSDYRLYGRWVEGVVQSQQHRAPSMHGGENMNG